MISCSRWDAKIYAGWDRCMHMHDNAVATLPHGLLLPGDTIQCSPVARRSETRACAAVRVACRPRPWLYLCRVDGLQEG